MNDYVFIDLDGTLLFGTILNAALLGGLIYLTVRVVRTVLKKTENKDDK
ncbi:MAG: hypothetical protein K2J11_12530 [Oscillospiraceae bacterium]|nr:hypothetical protein [Oscillospiraceae bacterium]